MEHTSQPPITLQGGPAVRVEFRPEQLRAIHGHNQQVMKSCHQVLQITTNILDRVPSDAARGFFKDLGETLKSIIEMAHAPKSENEKPKKGRSMLITWLRVCRTRMERLAHRVVSYSAEMLGYSLPQVCLDSKEEVEYLEETEYSPFDIQPDDGTERLVVVTTKPALMRIIKANTRAVRGIRTIHERMLWLEKHEEFPPTIVARIYPHLTPISIGLEQVNRILEKMLFESYQEPFEYEEEVEEVEETVLEQVKPATPKEPDYNKTSIGSLIGYSRTTYKLVSTASIQLYELYRGLTQGGEALVYYDPAIKQKIRKIIVRVKAGEEPPTPEDVSWQPTVSSLRDQEEEQAIPDIIALRETLDPRHTIIRTHSKVTVSCDGGMPGKWLIIRLLYIFFLLYRGFMQPMRT